MVDVHQQREVHAFRRESGILDGASNGLHIFDFSPGGPAADDLKHLVLNIDGQHAPCGSHPLGQTERKISRSGSDVGDRHSFQGSQSVQQSFGLLFGLPLGAIQPGSALVAHDPRDLPVHVELSGSVGIGAGPVFVAGRLGSGDAGKQQKEAGKEWKRTRFHGTPVYQQREAGAVDGIWEWAVAGWFDSPAPG